MSLTQIQIIQSLGEALNWMEKELSWGVPATELTHLSGRIGELYAALLSNGQMATKVNQKGYDVVSDSRGKISVKTTARTSYSGPLTFNSNTLDEVDWVMVLKLDTDAMEIQVLLDTPKEKALEYMTLSDKKWTLPLSKFTPKRQFSESIKVVDKVEYREWTIQKVESGTIELKKSAKFITPVKPVLEVIAEEIGVDLFNSNGNRKNTRQLGATIIQALKEAHTESSMTDKYPLIVAYDNHSICRSKSKQIQVVTDGMIEKNAIAVLRKIAGDIGVDYLNSKGNKKNTQQLGADVIRKLTRVEHTSS